jgi:hypothetical protein
MMRHLRAGGLYAAARRESAAAVVARVGRGRRAQGVVYGVGTKEQLLLSAGMR